MSKKKEEAAKVAASSTASPAPGGKKNRPKHYQQKECPYCKVPVGNLPNHIRMKHAEQAAAEGIQVQKPEVSKDDLLGRKPDEQRSLGNDLASLTHPPIYYCQNCRAKLRKGEKECWNCHQILVWEGIE